ncbi:MAG: mandelate racemase/muconate lactonizing enzyme family protein [Ilumatobacteraceae bacterium]|nr:mandelate racemase/muconate lactonizing enzyme family protein [Ilumatobacteraceae bacterium]
MIIRNVDASWLSVPIPKEGQHVSDFGRISSFDTALVRVEVAGGLVGWGESKAAVGSAGTCAALVSCINEELGPQLVGQDARRITRLWEEMYNGSRAHYSLSRGRTFPALGRRGLNVAAISGVDMALWDLLGKSLGAPVVDLWGGACRAEMPLYASGGWADTAGIGAELNGYVGRGFSAVKMRVGVMDGDVDTSIARVAAARSALGPGIGLMVDAHGTFSASEAKRFAAGVEQFGVRWFEEPVSADDRRGAATVRSSTSIAIAAGESEFTRFDFRDLIEMEAVDVLQPDLAICGGPTEGRRIAALAEAYQLELAPHCWGSALSFSAGMSLAFASPAATVIEYSLGANPFLHELPEETIDVADGRVVAPTRPGLGVTPRQEFIAEHTRK